MQQEPSPWGLSLYKMCEFSDSQEVQTESGVS